MAPRADSTYGILVESKSQGSGFDESVRGIDKLDAGIQRLGRSASTGSPHTAALGQGIKTVALEAGAGASRLGSLATSLAGFNLGAAAAVGVTTGLAVGIMKLTSEIGDYAEKVDIAKESTDLTEKELGGLHVATSNVGRSFESILPNLAFFNRHISEAREGSGRAFDAFQKLGITLDDLKSKTTGELLQGVRDGLQNVGDASERSRVLFDLFGRSGASMIAILKQSATETEALALKLGITLTPAQMAAARAADVAGDRMKVAWGGLRNTIAASVAPAGTAIMNWATGTIEWLKKVSEEIEEHTVGAFKDLENAAKGLKPPPTPAGVVDIGDITVVGGARKISGQAAEVMKRAQDQVDALRQTIPLLDYMRSLGVITADQEATKLKSLRAQALTKFEILEIDQKIFALGKAGLLTAGRGIGPQPEPFDMGSIRGRDPLLMGIWENQPNLRRAPDAVSDLDQAMQAFVDTLKEGEEAAEFGRRMALTLGDTARAGVQGFFTDVISGSQKIEVAFGTMIQNVVRSLIASTATDVISGLFKSVLKYAISKALPVVGELLVDEGTSGGGGGGGGGTGPGGDPRPWDPIPPPRPGPDPSAPFSGARAGSFGGARTIVYAQINAYGTFVDRRSLETLAAEHLTPIITRQQVQGAYRGG